MPKAGDKVRIQRDETLYPPKGTWGQFRNKTGRVVSINRGRTTQVVGRPPGMSKQEPAFLREVKIETEYGVSFTKSSDIGAWFRAYELKVIKDREVPTHD